VARFCPETPAVVVTDSRRNARPLRHSWVLDVATPERLDDRQASLYLKTSLHRRLDPEHRYCYLDADVLAARAGAEQIFMYRLGPVTFAADHCRMRYFSPNAVRCRCWDEQRQRRAAELDALLRRLDHCPPELVAQRSALVAVLQEHEWRHRRPPPELARRRARVAARLERFAARPWLQLLALAAAELPELGPRLVWEVWRHGDPDRVIDAEMGEVSHWVHRRLGFTWDVASRQGFDRHGRFLLRDVPWYVARDTDFSFDFERQEWLGPDGEPAFHRGCDHLRQAIRDRFGVAIPEPDWQHWNGGVFLFDRRSAPFLDTWHDWTLAVLDDPGWQPRDQGTLIAAVWHHGLERQGTLPAHFNFLADYQNAALSFDPERGLTLDGGSRWLWPYFVHVYHQWGDRQWPVWRWLEERLAAAPGEQQPLVTAAAGGSR
jgi:hypothetical protein